MNLFFFSFFTFYPNSFLRFLGESMACQSAYSFIWPLVPLSCHIQELKIESVLHWLNLVAKKAKNTHNPLSSYLITGHIKIPAIWHAFESRFLCILCAWIGDVGYIAQQIGFKPPLKEHFYSKSPVFSRDISSILQLKGKAFIGYKYSW